MASDLTRGSYAGKETTLARNTATHAAPIYSVMKRVRNVQVTDGPGLGEVNNHGAGSTGNIPGYDKFAGSFEYVRRRGVDPDYNALKTAKANKSILCLRYLNDQPNVSGAEGWDAPVLLGEFSENSNGGDGVVVTIPFAKADAFDANGDAVEKEDVVIA